jgi:hypothetical protein
VDQYLIADGGYLLSKQQRIAIIKKRDGNYCFICKSAFTSKDKVTIDHWIPLSRGGSWNLDNLRIAHKKCNAWKGDRVPNLDGTIPPPQKKEKKAPKAKKPSVCPVCLSGRKLGKDQFCGSCGSGPQPLDYPRWAKRKISECDHKVFFCFGCTIGFIERKPSYRLDNYGR